MFRERGTVGGDRREVDETMWSAGCLHGISRAIRAALGADSQRQRSAMVRVGNEEREVKKLRKREENWDTGASAGLNIRAAGLP
jgi:hypothetical protein